MGLASGVGETLGSGETLELGLGVGEDVEGGRLGLQLARAAVRTSTLLQIDTEREKDFKDFMGVGSPAKLDDEGCQLTGIIAVIMVTNESARLCDR